VLASPSVRRALLALCLAGLVLRAGFLALEPPVERMGDEPSWISLAVHGLAELKRPLHPFSKYLLFYPPLYPFFLAVPYKLTGGLAAAQWAQVLVSTLLIPAVGMIGARCFSARTALLAAAVVAVPLFKRLGLGLVLGYLAGGAVIGPSGFGWIGNVESTLHFAEMSSALSAASAEGRDDDQR